MNRIVKEHYPIARLPEDLRDMFPGQDYIRLVMEEPINEKNSSQPEKEFSLDRLFAQATPAYDSLEEIAAHVRAMRDEWD